MSISRRGLLAGLATASGMAAVDAATGGTLRLKGHAAAPPYVPSLISGNVAYRSWAIVPQATLDVLSPAGVSTQVGYNQRAKGCHLTPMFQTIGVGQSIDIWWAGWGNPTFADVAAGNYHGVAYSEIQVDNGPVIVVPGMLRDPHPISGQPAYRANYATTGKASSGPSEIRIKIFPTVGRPFLLQGRPAAGPANATQASDLTDIHAGPRDYSIDTRTIPGILQDVTAHAISITPDMWSLIVNVDKGDLNRMVLKYDSVNATGLASDSNNGLTSTTPLRTWEGVIAKWEAAYGAGDGGGLTVQYTGASLLHTQPGWATAITTIYPAIDRCVHIERDPNMPAASVAIGVVATNPFLCEKLTFGSFANRLQVQGQGITNSDPLSVLQDNGVWRNYMHTMFLNVDHDGGSAVVASGPYTGEPVGNPLLVSGTIRHAGHCQFYNVNTLNAGSGKMAFWSTLLLNVLMDTMSTSNDMANTCKAISGLTIRRTTSKEGIGGQHPDAYQVRSGRTMHCIWGLNSDFPVEVTIQGGLADNTAPMTDFVWDNCQLGSGPAMTVNAKPTNVLFKDLRMLGQVNPGYRTNGNAFGAVAEDCRSVITGLPNQTDVFETTFITGWSKIYDTALAEPGLAAAATEWDDVSPLEVIDADIKEFIHVVDQGSNVAYGTSLRVFQMIDPKDPAGGSGLGRVYQMRDTVNPTLDARRPLYLPTSFGASRAGVDFDGDNGAGSGTTGGGTLAGVAIGSGPLTPSAAQGAGQFETWWLGDNKHSVGDTSATGRALIDIGRRSCQLLRYFASGAVRLKAGMGGLTPGSAFISATCQDLTFVFAAGAQFIRTQWLSDRAIITVFDAAHPTGYTFPDGTFATGGSTKNTTVGSNSFCSLNGACNSSTGDAATFFKTLFNARIMTPVLDSTGVAFMVAKGRARCGF